MTKIVLAMAALAIWARGSVIVIVASGGEYRFVAGDRLEINGRDRVRYAAPAANYEAKLTGQLPTQKLSQIALIYWDPKLKQLRLPGAGTANVVLPDADKTDGPAADMWRRAQVSVGQAGTKQLTPLPAGEIWALIQGADAEAELAKYVSTESHFDSPGGTSETLQLQGTLIGAASAAFGKSAAISALRGDSEQRLRASLDRLNSGLAEMPDLQEARQRARVSALVYPKDAGQAVLRAKLEALERGWRETQAILKAFEAGSQWDAYLTKYKSFQRYEFLFPEFQEGFRKMLTASREDHKRMGAGRLEVKDCSNGLFHYRLALKRDPDDLMAREQVETARVCLVRTPRRTQSGPRGSSESELAPARRVNDFVERFLGENKLDGAESELANGLKLYPSFPPLLLSKARLLEKKNQLHAALAVLDQYDSLVGTQREWDEGDKARRDIEFQIIKGRGERLKKLADLIKRNLFGSALLSVQEGLSADEADQDLLFRGGILLTMLRQKADARAMLVRYLEASQSLSGNPERRKQAFALLGTIERAPSAAPPGNPNWFARTPLPEQTYYDPQSLAFNRRIQSISQTPKQVVEFRWAGDRLETVTVNTEEKPPRTIARTRFDYDAQSGVVQRVTSLSGDAQPAAQVAVPAATKTNLLLGDTVAVDKGVINPATPSRFAADIGDVFSEVGLPVLLAQNSRIDPIAVESLTGVQLGHTVTWNQYFHPCIWERPYSFRLSYDDQGRVARAFPAGPDKATAEVYVFTWDGMKLTELSVHPALPGLAPDKTKTLYRRTMQYADGRLTSERIEFGSSKPASVEYKYQNGQLLSAEANPDASLENRASRAMFAGR